MDPDDAALAGCKHIFHRECIMQYATCVPEKGKKVTCPVCRVPLTIDLQPTDLTGVPKSVANKALQAKKDELPSKSILSRIDLSQYTSSTKVEALIKGLRDMRSGKDGHLNKAIVFSQYTSMIEIVEWRLKKAQFTIAKLLGSMPVTQRAANLKAGTSPGGPSVHHPHTPQLRALTRLSYRSPTNEKHVFPSAKP